MTTTKRKMPAISLKMVVSGRFKVPRTRLDELFQPAASNPMSYRSFITCRKSTILASLLVWSVCLSVCLSVCEQIFLDVISKNTAASDFILSQQVGNGYRTAPIVFGRPTSKVVGARGPLPVLEVISYLENGWADWFEICTTVTLGPYENFAIGHMHLPLPA